MSKCKVKQYSDMAKCEKCGLCWDINDPCEPECKMYNDHVHKDEKIDKTEAIVFVCIIAVILIFSFLDC